MERLKKILRAMLLPLPVCVLLSAACAAALIWLFAGGREEQWYSYLIFAMSAYALTILCIRLVPALGKWIKRKKEKADAVDPSKKFKKSLTSGMAISLVYALANLAGGLLYQSVWMGSLGLYYLVLLLIRLVLLRYENRALRTTDPVQKEVVGWRGFRSCGVLLLILQLTMTGIVFQRIWKGKTSAYPGYFIFAVAAFTFYKITISMVRVIGHRKNPSALYGAARNVELTAALVSLFSLQTALLEAYDDGTVDVKLMNSLTGGAVCLLAVLGACGMIAHGYKREKELIGVEQDGK